MRVIQVRNLVCNEARRVFSNFCRAYTIMLEIVDSFER